MRCLMIHPSFREMGGGNKVNLTIIDELARRGHEVTVLLMEHFDKRRFFDFWHSIPAKEINTYSMFKCYIPKDLAFLLYPAFFIWTLRYLRQLKPELILYSDDVIGPVSWFLSRRTKVFLYAHFPVHIKLKTNYFLMKPTFLRALILYFIGRLPLIWFLREGKRADIIAVNSILTKRYIEKYWGRYDARLLLPPVEVSKFKPLEKDDSIVVLGAIQKYKRPDFVIESLRLCKLKPKLSIIGIVYDTEADYVGYIQGLASKLRMEDRVTLFPNATFNHLQYIVGRAKIIVHSSLAEAFGIAVVEGMAAGCVPIVYPVRGLWDHVIDYGKYGLSFTTKEELAQKIDMILGDPELFLKYSLLARKRALHFDEHIFRKKLASIIEGKASLQPRNIIFN